MKHLIFFLMLAPLSGLTQISDGFADGDFTKNPPWTGDSLKFQVSADHRLQLHSSGADTAYLSTPSAWLTENEWRFWIRVGFNTSSNNNARVYLAADDSRLDLNPDGFYLQVGGSADSIDLMKKSGMQLVHLHRFQSYSTVHSNNILRFRILRTREGQWDAYVDTTGGVNFIHDGSFPDTGTMQSCFMGVWCRFTSSNATRFYFDDFYAGPVIVDTDPPGVESAELHGDSELHLLFSEVPESVSATDPANYRLIAAGQIPDTVIQDAETPGNVILKFNPGLEEGLFDSLRISGVTDQAGNRIRDTLVPVCYYRSRFCDIVIHEIMADPEPSAGLPAGEFVELYNRTPFPVGLNNWTLRYGSTVRTFPAVTIAPFGYLIVARDSAYNMFGSCALLFTSSTSLSNEGTTLVIKDAGQHVIHTVSYLPGWFRGTFKEEGGWSLEMRDAGNPCGCAENWLGSCDPSGGTPGRANSIAGINADATDPFPVRATIVDTSAVQLFFSEPMDSLTMMELSSWRLSPDSRAPITVFPAGPDYLSAKLVFVEPFVRGEISLLEIAGNLRDCAGNRADTSKATRVSLPDSVIKNDLVINEILPDPRSGGSRFVEIFNRSGRVVDLSELLLATGDTSAGLLPDAEPLSEESHLIFPDDYIVLCADPLDISSRFKTPWPERMIRLESFPSMDDDTGVVILARRDNFALIDRVVYSKKMHYPLLVSVEGVSLERLSADRSSNDFSNWHSAASTVGFATPGYLNSQAPAGDGSDNFFRVFPSVISPDNDGNDDLLTIAVNTERPGYSAVLDIYDASGRRIRRLAGNNLLAAEGLFTWDGTTDNRTIVPMGIYILYAELVHPDGSVRRYKKAVTVSGKF